MSKLGTGCVVLAALGVLAGCSAPVDRDGAALGVSEHALESASASFQGCVESIGVGLAPIDHARSLVPPDVILVGEGGPVTPVVVRTALCDGIAVHDGASAAGSVVQIGLVIVPPDGTGDINNYTLWYYTSHQGLANRLGALGVDTQRVKQLAYEVEGGFLSVQVPSPGDPSSSLEGAVLASSATAGSFHANWWVDGGHGLVKMATVVPAIAIGTADLAFVTPVDPDLGALGLGNAPAPDFPALQQFNSFAAAEMTALIAD